MYVPCARNTRLRPAPSSLKLTTPTLESGAAGNADRFSCDDGEDYEDGGDCGDLGFKRGKGDARGCRGGRQQEGEALGWAGRQGCDNGGRVGAYLATGFADGFERLEDQEAGYAAFAAFLVRVLDQMP